MQDAWGQYSAAPASYQVPACRGLLMTLGMLQCCCCVLKKPLPLQVTPAFLRRVVITSADATSVSLCLLVTHLCHPMWTPTWVFKGGDVRRTYLGDARRIVQQLRPTLSTSAACMHGVCNRLNSGLHGQDSMRKLSFEDQQHMQTITRALSHAQMAFNTVSSRPRSRALQYEFTIFKVKHYSASYCLCR